MGVLSNIKHRWNAFFSNRDPTYNGGYSYGYSESSYRPDRIVLSPYTKKSIMAPIITRISNDVASIGLKHIDVGDKDEYMGVHKGALNDIFTYKANRDQTGEEFMRDIIMSMCDEGVVALVPTLAETGKYGEIFIPEKARVAKIVGWYPNDVKVNVYNEDTMKYEDLILPKDKTCIIENPFYHIMNTNNGSIKQYTAKSTQLDRLESRNSAGKLDLIIQLPYSLKTEQKRSYAEQRKRDIESQLIDSPYGIVYADSMERIIQLNRPAENTLVDQIEKLRNEIRNEMGLTEAVFNGTATEEEIINYENRTVKVLLRAVANSVTTTWISKEDYDNGQRVRAIFSPFRNVSMSKFADTADKLTRNAIVSTNEVRTEIGYIPSDDPDADALRNKNLNKSDNETKTEEMIQNGSKQD